MTGESFLFMSMAQLWCVASCAGRPGGLSPRSGVPTCTACRAQVPHHQRHGGRQRTVARIIGTADTEPYGVHGQPREGDPQEAHEDCGERGEHIAGVSGWQCVANHALELVMGAYSVRLSLRDKRNSWSISGSSARREPRHCWSATANVALHIHTDAHVQATWTRVCQRARAPCTLWAVQAF